jgi:hypothetical protein
MIEREAQDVKRARPQDRRVYERIELIDAHGSLIYMGAVIPCTFIDISLGGCCMRTETPFEAGALANVEVVLAIYGLALRIRGVTQWTRWDHQIGVRFLYGGAQSRNQLVGLLTCLIDKNAVAVVQQAVASERLVNRAVAQRAAAEIADPPPTLNTQAQEEAQQQPAEEQTVHRDRRSVQNLDEGHGPTVVHFLKDNIDCRGDIVDLSLDGCSVRTAAPYAWKLHLRVEVIFHMRGLPFQLAGVTSTVHDRRTAGIHFTEMSHRKREELAQVIDELIDISKAKKETRDEEPVALDTAAEDS